MRKYEVVWGQNGPCQLSKRGGLTLGKAKKAERDYALIVIGIGADSGTNGAETKAEAERRAKPVKAQGTRP